MTWPAIVRVSSVPVTVRNPLSRSPPIAIEVTPPAIVVRDGPCDPATLIDPTAPRTRLDSPGAASKPSDRTSSEARAAAGDAVSPARIRPRCPAMVTAPKSTPVPLNRATLTRPSPVGLAATETVTSLPAKAALVSVSVRRPWESS